MLVSRVVGKQNCKRDERPKISQFPEERRLGDDQRSKYNGHWSEMEPEEVFQTSKNTQVGNEKILQYMERHNQINQQLMQNLMQMHDKV